MLPQLETTPVREFLDDLCVAILDVEGGLSVPLYGTMICGLGARLEETEDELDEDSVRRMFAGSLEEISAVTKAKAGDQTMMDALIPAAEAAQTAEGDVKAILRAAAEVAEAGAKASEGFVPKVGCTRNDKEQTIGTPDVGAVSVSLFIRGLEQGLSPLCEERKNRNISGAAARMNS